MIISISDSLKQKRLECPGKEALVYREERLNYQAFDNRVDTIAGLLVKNGLRKNDRCAVYLGKSTNEALSLLAVNRAGGIFVDINHLLKPQQVKYIINDSGARFLITSSQRCKAMMDAIKECPDLEAVFISDGNDLPETRDLNMFSLHETVSDADHGIFPDAVETDIAAIIYTSGSTGQPKGVVITQRNLMAGAESVAQYLQITGEDRILSVLPFSFDYGLNQLTTSIYTGATCVLMNYLFPVDILKYVEKEAITGVPLIPPLWLQLLQKDWDHSRFPSWRYLTNTGGAMPASAVKELARRLPRTQIFLMYGLTEAFRATYLPPEQINKRPESIGIAIPNAEIWVLNENGEHCKPGEEGELVQRGAHVASGYWNDDIRTNERFKPSPMVPKGLRMQEYVVYSGDTVKKDEEGYIYFVGRADEMIKTSGYRVSPSEIEAVLYSTGVVLHAAVFGIPDTIQGQRITAVVSAKENCRVTEKALKEKCAHLLPNYMQPSQFLIWENLPVNPTGKIDRNAIKNGLL